MKQKRGENCQVRPWVRKEGGISGTSRGLAVGSSPKSLLVRGGKRAYGCGCREERKWCRELL